MPKYVIIIANCPNCGKRINLKSESPRQDLAQCSGCNGTFENSLADKQLAAIEESLNASFAKIPSSNMTITIKMGHITIPMYETLQALDRNDENPGPIDLSNGPPVSEDC